MAAVLTVTHCKLSRVIEQLVRDKILTFEEYSAVVGACELVSELKLVSFTDGYGVCAHNTLTELLKKEHDNVLS